MYESPIKLFFPKLEEEICNIAKKQDEMVFDAIANGVVVQRWIPVAEQLPAAGRHVLIYRANGRVSIGHMLLLEAGLDMNNWYKDGVAKFHDVTSYRLVGVTHWMPLPDPPKEVE